jgi:chitodextrinase
MNSRLRAISFSNPIFLIFYALIFSVGAFLLIRSFAAPPATPSVYLEPSTRTLPINTTFTVALRASSGTTPVNAIQANISYPAALLDFVSIDSTGTAFSVEAQSTGGTGTITIARGNTTAQTGDMQVANITFRTRTTSGAAAVAFTAGTSLVNATTNTNILPSLASTFGGTYTIDATAPTVSITTPTNGSTIGVGTNNAITASASDNSSITNVQILIDGATVATLTTSPYTYTWNTSGASKTTHTIQARATDPYGNTATSSLITVTVADRTAPSVSITAPANNATVSGGSVNIAATSTDNVGGDGVARVEFYVDGTLRSTDTTSPYAYTWDSRTVSDGSHSLTARSYDNAVPANMATSSAVNVTVDNADRTAPSTPGSLTVTSRTLNSISLSWTASTDNVGVTGYRIQRAGVTVATVGATTLTYTNSGLTNGTNYTFTVQAIDAAGNASTAATVSTSTIRLIPGDVNSNGVVDIFDLSLLLNRWGTTDVTADLNQNGIVDIFDLSILLTNWGQS